MYDLSVCVCACVWNVYIWRVSGSLTLEAMIPLCIFHLNEQSRCQLT